MVVVVEGLDCTGKTTIAKKIAEDYQMEYVKESYTDDTKEKEYRIINMMERVIKKENCIYDRTTLIDDFVYDFLNKKQSTLNDYFDIICDVLSRCKIIHLNLDEKVRVQRFRERGDLYINEKDIATIKENYENFYNHLDNVQQIDLSGDLEKDAKKIGEVIFND